jgi:predicted metal-dependent hydrolase
MMNTVHIRLGDMEIAVTFKAIRNVYLSVRPPRGNVTLVVPVGMRLEVVHAYAVSKLGWIHRQQARLQRLAHETPRQFVTGESHYIWGKCYLLDVVQRDAPPSVRMDHQHISLSVRPDADSLKRAAIYQRWQRSLLHSAIPPLITHWESRLGVKVATYFLQRMKTRWGSCNVRRGHIRLNTELVKKPQALLEYVVVHEMVHLIEPTHNARFTALLDQFYPTWREARAGLRG